jgi:hypothetical protein
MACCLLALALAALPYGISTQGQRQQAINEQAFFSADEDPQRPVVLAPNVLNVLLALREVKESMERASDSERKNPEQLFRAAEVHLRSAAEVDLVIMGRRPLTGADNSWFWVVRSIGRKPKVVLFTGGNSLELSRTRTNGYHNVRTLWFNPNGTMDDVVSFQWYQVQTLEGNLA